MKNNHLCKTDAFPMSPLPVRMSQVQLWVGLWKQFSQLPI